MIAGYPHWSRFDLPNTHLDETTHWLLALRQKQITIGSCVLLLKRPVESLADMTPEEGADFPSIVALFERLTRNAFGAERHNYMAMMMKDPYVHFHAFPRYGSERTFGGLTWVDKDWPRAMIIREPDNPAVDQAALRTTLLAARG